MAVPMSSSSFLMKCVVVVGISVKKKKRKLSYVNMQKCGTYSMYKRCICEISLCIIKFKQFKMMSLFQHNHKVRFYHLQDDESLN